MSSNKEMINTDIISNNVLYQSLIIEQQSELIKLQSDLFDKMINKYKEKDEQLDRVTGCLYQLIDGLFSQKKQDNIINNYYDAMLQQESLESDVQNEDYFPTTHQGDNNEFRINNLMYVMAELLTTMENKKMITKFEEKFYKSILDSKEDYTKHTLDYDGYDDDAETVITFPDIDQEEYREKENDIEEDEDEEDNLYCDEVAKITNSIKNTCRNYPSKIEFNDNFYGNY
uniref:Uncharacterized protein n=1 Tax=viral metagenome TaxID=1070528 RepID=A0A6C0ERR4_9ZZZZ